MKGMIKKLLNTFTILAVVSVPFMQVRASEESSSTRVEAKNSYDEWDWWIFASEEYRLRTSKSSQPSQTGDALTSPAPASEDDHDMRLSLDTGFRDPSGHWGGEVSAGLWADLDGTGRDVERAGLVSMYDYEQPWWDVYTLQADYESDGVLGLARAGRQTSLFGLPATFDGATVLLNPSKPYLELFVFGGRSVHFFDVSDGLFEDWIASAGSVIRPLKWLKLELDYRFLKEDILLSDKETTDALMDHSYGLKAWVRHDDWFRANAYVRGLNDSVSHAGAAALFEHTGLDLGADLGLDTQVTGLREINESQDAYFVLLGQSLPSIRWILDVWKIFDHESAEYGLHAGWKARNLLDDNDAPFNRNTSKVYLLFTVNDFLTKGPYFSASVEDHFVLSEWETTGEHTLTAGGSAGYEYKRAKVEAGTYYHQYKYDYYVDVLELEDVRTYYGLMSYRILDWLKLKAGYEVEIMDRDVHTVTLTLSQMY